MSASQEPGDQADIGIAMGAGTDIAIESADVVLVGNRLTAVAGFLARSGLSVLGKLTPAELRRWALSTVTTA